MTDLDQTINVTVYDNIGEKGDKGDTGNAATVSVGATSTLSPGVSASVSNVGTEHDAILNFGIPQGIQGPPNVLTISSVTTGAPGSQASAAITGTSPVQSLSFTIPRGDKGEKGNTGDKGDQGVQGPSNVLTVQSVVTGTPGSSAVVEITGGSPNQALSFTIPRGDKGEKGNTGDVGPANTLTIPSGGVTTGAAGSNATATISGTAPNQLLSFIIPRGDKGETGNTGVIISSSTPSITDILWADTNITTPVYTPVPSGGLNGQALVKVSDSDYALGWANPTISPSNVVGTAVINSDARLIDTRTPTDGTVTDAKVASNAAIDVSKLSNVTALSVISSVLDIKPNTAETTQRRSSSTAQSLTLGTVFFTHFSTLYSFSATNVVMYCSTAHTGTPTNVKVGLYSFNETDGYTLLNSSSNSANILSGTGFRTFTIPSTQLTAGGRYALGIIIVGATTTASVYGRTDNGAFNAGTNTGVDVSFYRFSWSYTSQTDLPATLAYATGTATASSQWSRIS